MEDDLVKGGIRLYAQKKKKKKILVWMLQLFKGKSLCSTPLEVSLKKATRKLTPIAQLFILNIVLQKPGIYLREIQTELQQCKFINFMHIFV